MANIHVYRHPAKTETITINPGLAPGITTIPRDWIVERQRGGAREIECKEFVVYFVKGMATDEPRLARHLIEYGHAHAAPSGD
jgi:hypothetical protein